MQKILIALLVAAAVGVVLLFVSPRPAPAPGRPAASGVVNPPDPPAVNPAPYLAAFPLAPLAAPPVTDRSPAALALETALVPYRKGDYAAAATALDGVRLDHPDNPAAALYLGISRLFIDEPQNALEILRGLPEGATPEVAGEAAWYSLVGIARLRDPSHVEAEARALCSSALPTASRACAALEALAKARGTGSPAS